MSTQKPTTKEYFRNYPGFRIESGNRINDGELKGKTVDVSIVTDELKDLHIIKTDIINLYAMELPMALWIQSNNRR